MTERHRQLRSALRQSHDLAAPEIELAFPKVQICVADPAMRDLDEHLRTLGAWNLTSMALRGSWLRPAPTSSSLSPLSMPLTGASIRSTPLDASLPCMRCSAIGSMVLITDDQVARLRRLDGAAAADDHSFGLRGRVRDWHDLACVAHDVGWTDGRLGPEADGLVDLALEMS